MMMMSFWELWASRKDVFDSRGILVAEPEKCIRCFSDHFFSHFGSNCGSHSQPLSFLPFVSFLVLSLFLAVLVFLLRLSAARLVFVSAC